MQLGSIPAEKPLTHLIAVRREPDLSHFFGLVYGAQ